MPTAPSINSLSMNSKDLEETAWVPYRSMFTHVIRLKSNEKGRCIVKQYYNILG